MLLHAIVRGRVQGVGFRYWTVDQAQNIGLKGYVRNMADGAVEIVAEAEEDLLRRFEEILWRGPVISRVDDVECNYSNETRNYSGFHVTY